MTFDDYFRLAVLYRVWMNVCTVCEYTDLQANLAPGSEHTYSIYIHGSTTDLQRRQGSILPHRGPPYERPGLSI